MRGRFCRAAGNCSARHYQGWISRIVHSSFPASNGPRAPIVPRSTMPERPQCHVNRSLDPRRTRGNKRAVAPAHAKAFETRPVYRRFSRAVSGQRGVSRSDRWSGNRFRCLVLGFERAGRWSPGREPERVVLLRKGVEIGARGPPASPEFYGRVAARPMTEAPSGAKRNSDSKRSSFRRIPFIPVYVRNRAIRPEASRGCSASSSHGWK
jgi:hypothetical protein